MNSSFETDTGTGSGHELVLAILAASSTIERRLDRALASIKGITFSEYQLLHALQAEHDSTATRVDLSDRVGLTPSGVTRALKPLERLGFVETSKDVRDARRSLATLTEAGHELVSDATGVVDDVISDLPGVSTIASEMSSPLLAVLREVG